MKRIICILALVTALIPEISKAAAHTTTDGYITYMEGGWASGNLRVQTDFAFTNPANCSSPDGYITDPADSGSSLFNALLMNAYMSHKKVHLVLDGCTVGRPHIISVAVLSN